MTTQHTPTPWSNQGSSIKKPYTHVRANGELLDTALTLATCHGKENSRENAAFIVRACNEYASDKTLIAELSEALELVISVSDRKTDIYDKAKQALAKAKGDA